MVQISRNKVPKNTLEKIFTILFEVLGKKKDEKGFQSALSLFLSPTERIMAAKRVAILYLLHKGIPSSTICTVLKVSKSTVSKYSILLEKDSTIKDVFSRILRQEKALDVFESLLDILRGPGVPGANWKVGWERKRDRKRRHAEGL